jgi:sigma-E factor negative regulatory protein RseA
MKASISALMDGDLEAGQTETVIAALRHEGEAREAWRTYHLIGDAMRDSRVFSPGFAARVTELIEQEPTVLAPVAAPRAAPWPRWGAKPIAVSVAASFAAIALVAGLTQVSQQTPQAPAPMAQPASAVLVQNTPPPAAAAPARAEPARVPLPAATDDYLIAHQRYSPRHALQGMAPYVRTVSAESGVRKP